MKAAGLTYEEAGDGDVPTLCLHGIGGNTRSFEPQLNGLDGRVIAVNLPGYGGSDLSGELSFNGLADAVVGFMDALDFPRARFCGQSIGGMIALEMAALYPKRVASLALIATTSAFGGRDDSFKDAFLKARLAPLDDGQTLPDLAWAFVPEITGPKASPDAIASAIASMSAVPETTYRAILRCLVTFNRRDALPEIHAPACLIAGSHDRQAPPKTMARMAEKMPYAEFHELEGAGHLVNLEVGDETNAILNAFHARLT